MSLGVAVMRLFKRGLALVALTMSFSLSAQNRVPVGWVVSQANCINNESFTWSATVRVINFHGPIFYPKGIPALRMTVSTHYDRLNDVSHTIRTGNNLEFTWRSAAIDWLAGLPTYIGTRWVVRYVAKWRLVRTSDGWKLVCTLRPVRVRVLVFMTDRWVVSGDHWEDVGAGVTHRRTLATDCNWGNTFDVKGNG